MHIWVGIDVDSQLTCVRERAEAVERQIGVEHSCYTLPMHVSLKMSFPVDDGAVPEVIARLEEYFSASKPFTIRVRDVECEGPIVWIRMERSAELDGLHDGLNAMLLSRYGVALHEYDTDYKFHATLFMSYDFNKVHRAFDSLRGIELPDTLAAKCFVIGASPSGALGTYKVIKAVCV